MSDDYDFSPDAFEQAYNQGQINDELDSWFGGVDAAYDQLINSRDEIGYTFSGAYEGGSYIPDYSEDLKGSYYPGEGANLYGNNTAYDLSFLNDYNELGESKFLLGESVIEGMPFYEAPSQTIKGSMDDVNDSGSSFWDKSLSFLGGDYAATPDLTGYEMPENFDIEYNTQESGGFLAGLGKLLGGAAKSALSSGGGGGGKKSSGNASEKNNAQNQNNSGNVDNKNNQLIKGVDNLVLFGVGGVIILGTILLTNNSQSND
jgi:hypothetical protein